jgi:hypothetical protein
LRVPYTGVKGHIELERVALDLLRPIVARYGATLTSGTFAGRGDIEYAPETKVLDLQELTLHGLCMDYAYRKRTVEPVKTAAQATAETAAEVSNKPGVLLKARRIVADGATVGSSTRSRSRTTGSSSLTRTWSWRTSPISGRRARRRPSYAAALWAAAPPSRAPRSGRRRTDPTSI